MFLFLEDETRPLLGNSRPVTALDISNPNSSPSSYEALRDPMTHRSHTDEGTVKAHEVPEFQGSSYEIMASAEVYMQSSDLLLPNGSFDVYEDELIASEENAAPSYPGIRCPSIQSQQIKVRVEFSY